MDERDTESGEKMPEAVRVAIAANLPRCAAEWKQKLFALCWSLKAEHRLCGADGWELLRIADAFRTAAGEVMAGVDLKEVRAEFLLSWHGCRHQKGDRPIDSFMDDALLRPSVSLPGWRSSLVCQLVARLCRELSRGGRFFLGCRMAGEQAGCTFQAASRELRWLCEEGVLHLEEPGSWFVVRGLRKASEYLWTGKES